MAAPDETNELHFETLAAQAGLKMRVGDAISTSPPIDASTTFTYDSVSEVHEALTPDPTGFAYARNGNPTVVALESAMASLQGSEDVVAFGSGMAAIHASLVGLQLWPGDSIVCSSDLYGVTRALLAQFAQYEIETHYVNVFDEDEVSRTIAATGARALYFESISNPLLRVPDAARLIEIATQRRAAVLIDNTFATPYMLRPIALGAELVIDSATKYIAGHGDVLAGLVAGRRSFTKRVRDARTVHGGVLSPFEAWLTLRGVRTLPLRVARQSATALLLADWLSTQGWTRRVYYPGLASHAQHDIATRQFSGMYGGMIAVDLAANRGATLQFIDALQLITPGTSLGDVESLVLYPPLSSHRSLDASERLALGIGDGLVRISVGIEHPKDLMDDLQRAARIAGIVG